MKKSKVARFSAEIDNETDGFECTEAGLSATIFGRPQPYKRPGWGKNNSRRYNPNKKDQEDFIVALQHLCQKNNAVLPSFGSSELEAILIFTLPRRSPNTKVTSSPDIDNLAKFIFDALQISGVFENDAQISRLVVEKKIGGDSKHQESGNSNKKGFDGDCGGSTKIILRRRIIEIE